MKNIFLSFLLFIIFNNLTYSKEKHINTEYDPNVTIEILNVVTNGLLLPNNTFSFNGVDDLVIEFDVKTTYSGANFNYHQGFSNCALYEPNEFDNETEQYYNNGVSGMHLYSNEIILEPNSDNNTRSHTFHKKLHFKRNTVYNTGFSIVFRYRVGNSALTKLTYSLIGGTKVENGPYFSPTSNITLNSISYSNGLSLIDDKIVVPESGHETDGEEIGTRSINLSFSFNCTHGSNLGLGYYPNISIDLAQDNRDPIHWDEWPSSYELAQLMLENYQVINLTGMLDPKYDTNGSYTVNNIKIKPSEIGPNSFVRITLKFQSTTTYFYCALVKMSRPIRSNTIGDNQTLFPGQFANNFTSSQPIIWTSGGNCPYRTNCNDPMIHTNITEFQWQKKENSNIWGNVANANTKDYYPTNTFSSNTSYRRIAYFNGLYNISNEINIAINDSPIDNTICCDQNLYANGQPQQLNGSSLQITGNFSYQWQIATSQFEPYNWTNISGANSQNYIHFFTSDANRSTEFTRFRRLIIQNNVVVNTSNTSIIKRRGTPNVNIRTNGSELENNTKDIIDNDLLIVFPNPSQDFITIESSSKININKIHLYNIQNIKLNPSRKVINDNSFELDLTNIEKGIYILKIEGNDSIIKKIIKN